MWCKRVLLRVIVGMRSSCSTSAECKHRNHVVAGSNLFGFFNWYFAPIYALLVNWLLRFWNLLFYAKRMLKSFFFSGISPFWQISQISAIFVLLFFVQKWCLNKKVLLKLFVQWHVPLKYLIEAYFGPWNSSQVIGSTRDIIF